MMINQNQPSGSLQLGNIRRKTVNIDVNELIKTEYLNHSPNFPLIIKPAFKGVDLLTWAKSNREFLQAELLKCAAILFRGFNVTSIEEFEQIIAAICGEALEYRYRASPRTQVAGRIYTSTDYPADQSIFPHNERQAYQQQMVRFTWEKGDVLMLDNMLAIHARNPFVPPRKILVGMAEPHTPSLAV